MVYPSLKEESQKAKGKNQKAKVKREPPHPLSRMGEGYGEGDTSFVSAHPFDAVYPERSSISLRGVYPEPSRTMTTPLVVANR
jgi:hypothetical protein